MKKQEVLYDDRSENVGRRRSTKLPRGHSAELWGATCQSQISKETKRQHSGQMSQN